MNKFYSLVVYSFAFSFTCDAFSQDTPSPPALAVEQAHTEMWRRFIDKYGVMLDFTDLDGTVSLPTAEECKLGKPNALGWWSPIENGAMFNGMYMDAIVNRWRRSGLQADADKARRLMEGLLLMSTISEVKGFVGRGVSTDGRSHYPMGSNDQTFPWFLGLWYYLDAGLATTDEVTRIKSELVETADRLVELKWAMPAEAPFGKRGTFQGHSFDHAVRLLFVCKMMFMVTKDSKWDELYRKALAETGGKENLSRQEVCKRGMIFEYAKYHTWTSCSSVAALRALWEMEKEETILEDYRIGLQASADLAFKSLSMAEKFDSKDTSHFEMNWRVMNELWQEQKTEGDSVTLANLQLKSFHKVSPRRAKETEFIREPTSAAWVVSLAPDKEILRMRQPSIEKVIAHYDYSRLYYSQFFWVECAWWRLQDR